MKLVIETLSPVHIGSEQKYHSIDYICESGKVRIISESKLMEKLSEKGIIEEYISEVKTGEIKSGKDIKRFARKHGVRFDDVIEREIPADDEISGEISSYIKTDGKYYMPGTSIKGMIRTCVAYHYLKNNISLLKKEIRNIWKKRAKYEFSELNRRIFGDPHRDPFKNLLIKDSEFIEEKNIKIFNVRRLYIAKRVKGVPQPCEAIVENTKINSEINLLNIPILNKNLKDVFTDLKNIFKIVNEFFEEFIKMEINEIKKAKEDNPIRSLIDFYEDLLYKMKSLKQNECIGRIGFGKTFWCQTVIMLIKDDKDILRQWENYQNTKYWTKRRLKKYLPDTRAVIMKGENVIPPGWVKMSYS